MDTDFGAMEKLPLKKTPELMRYLARHGHVVCVHKTPYGTVMDCDDYIRQATPEELEARKREVQRVAAELLHNLQTQTA